ncbi:MAG: V-type ATP synthase subunit E [Planctomycetota bacterium]|jgi:V/A-type H+-transporting ATPase subunit E
MEAQQVTDKILADANAEADQIKNQAQDKHASEQSQFDEQLRQYKEQSGVLAQKAGEDKKSHLLAAARMDIAKQQLAEKAAILDEVFNQAHSQLLKLSDDDYKKLCTKMMLAAVETGDEEVIVDQNDKRIDQEFIKSINRELGPGFKGNLRLANENKAIEGGFLLRRGKITTNVSFGVLLNQARNNLEIELANDLFGN